MVQLGDPRTFANTYSPDEETPGWERVQQYRAAMNAAAESPSLGSTAIAGRVEQPRSRVRPWIRDDNPAIPDVERGLQTAESRGWLEVKPDTPRGHALLSLVAWIFSSGSITVDNSAVRFVASTANERDRLFGAIERIGASPQARRTDDPQRANEYTVKRDPSVLARVLEAIGAPLGTKAGSDLSLPAVLDDLDAPEGRVFAATYLQNRGTRGERDANFLQIREVDRGQYLTELHALFERVAERGHISLGQDLIRFDAEAVASIIAPV